MPVPQWTPDAGPSHSVLTLIGRPGFVVFGRGEREWLEAWHFSNCHAHVYRGELVLVTDHGWCDLMGRSGSATPRLVA